MLPGHPPVCVQYASIAEHSQDALRASSNWKVHEAFYGLADRSAGTDVTSEVQQQLQTEGFVRATNVIFRDPCPGEENVIRNTAPGLASQQHLVTTTTPL